MSKYPYVIVLRQGKYKTIDDILTKDPQFTYKITENIDDIKLLYDEHWNILLTVGDSWQEYPIQNLMIIKTFQKWLHIKPEEITIETVANNGIVYNKILSCYIQNLPKREIFRPKISCFTTSFKSGHKILRPYNSLLMQTEKDWEWIILDDTPGDENFKWLIETLKDSRIRLYKPSQHSGSIGALKNQASSLCRGKYLLELDHDDDIMPDCLETLIKAFESDPEVGFVYMDFAELFEDWKNFSYGDGWGMGLGSYYRQFVATETRDGTICLAKDQKNTKTGKWLYSAKSCDINSIACQDITAVPNHPRCWRKDVLQKIGYSESLPVADDIEVLLLTILNYKVCRVAKLGYLQYKNEGNNNFSLIRNQEITKLQRAICAYYKPQFDKFFKVKAVAGTGPFWQRGDNKDNRINTVVNFDYDMTVCILDINHLTSSTLQNMYKNERCDFILVLSNNDGGIETLLETLDLYRIRFHVIENATKDQMKAYFFNCYLTTKKSIVLE
uniref:Glycosyltransferase 2-like domain-containing protein n=1 Tax=viral metagenome TaxID=1070528 RepID=A0A6C0JXM0_9ZZZZ